MFNIKILNLDMYEEPLVLILLSASGFRQHLNVACVFCTQ